MNGDLIFLLLFLINILGLFIIRTYYTWKSPDRKKSINNLTKQGFEHESPLTLAIGFFAGISWIAALILYIFFPFLLPFVQLLFPDWLRWIGVIIGFISLAFFWWVHSALGREFSKTLTIQDQHTLITDGPYRRIRHPMYATLILYFLSWFLISANALLFLAWILLVIFMVARIPREEAMLIDQFGDEYKQYMSQTGRLLPPFRKKKTSEDSS